MIDEIESHREEFGGWVTDLVRAGSIISALGRSDLDCERR
jgi:hypothetical protein